jgi:O-succinylbenzoic acid--CoA ligase
VTRSHSLSLRQAAAEHPGAPALIVDGGALSYAQLAARATDVRPRAVLVAHPQVPQVVALLAALQDGRPTVLLHPALGPAERARALEGLPDLASAADDLAVVVFTSGTQGRPRAVGLPARALLAAAEASARHLGWQDDDRWLLALPFAHVGGLSVITRCLVAGRPVVLAPEAGRDAGAFVQVVERDRVTLASLVPAQLRRLLDATPDWRPPPYLRAVLLGGAAAPVGLLAEARQRGWPVVASYGMSETSAQVATARLDEPPGAGLHPLPGVRVRVVEGEIQVHGPTVMSGYLGTPDGAASPFTADGWLRTGDVGRFDEAGRLHVLGRRDDRLKTGGEVVDPLEVERVLEGWSGVAEACVFGVPDQVWGQRVAAALVLRPDQVSIDRPALSAYLAGQLASFKRPRSLVVLPAFPAAPSGKRDRHAVGQIALPLLENLPLSSP